AEFMFMLTDVSQINDPQRRFSLSEEDFFLLNPNTHTCPIFRTSIDAELTKKIYNRVPVLVNEHTGTNPWGVSFIRMFDMANDSQLFYDSPSEGMVRLYEAKMMYQYDHRFSTYENATESNINEGNLPQLTSQMHEDPYCFALPRYWLLENCVENRLSSTTYKKWLLAFRD